MALEVIGAGYGRTGTESLRAALESLGFGPCHHMHVMRDHPEYFPVWQDFAVGKHKDWDALYEGFRAAVDFPTAAYWRELVSHFPKAKVILTTRDPEAWYESATASVMKLIAERDQIKDPHQRDVLEFSDKIVGKNYFKDRGADKDYMIGRLVEHERNVRQALPEDRLLVYRVSEGWEPLCSFLEVDVPQIEFPFANSKDDYRKAWD